MRILYLSSPGGGLETNVRVLAPALIQAGHQVSILYLDARVRALAQTNAQGITEYRAPIGSKHYYLHRATFGIGHLGKLARAWEHSQDAARAICEIARRQPLDLIELPEMFVRKDQLPAPYVMRLHSSAWMCRKLFGEPVPPTDALEIRLESQTLARAAAITSPSRFVAQYVTNVCRVQRPIEIIPYPVDTDLFQPSDHPRRQMVLFVGRVEKRKGADTLMRAIPTVLQKFPDCEFVFAGRMSEELAALAATMPPPVKFLGVKPRGELVELYRQASVVAVPSVWDNSPNVIYEAMACGAPVVATNVGGIPELVEDGVTGLLVPPNEMTLGSAIGALLRDANKRCAMSVCARQRAVQTFAVEKILNRTLKAYRKVLDA
jgi:glycosyltransferase involved in cell wall biosynthesis